MDELIREVRAAFDVERPLPGSPEPWAHASMPRLRAGPPYAMTEMIAAEPALAARVVARAAQPSGEAEALAHAIRETAHRREPVVVTGCGTSDHGAQGVVELVREGWRAAALPGDGPSAAQAFELALDPPSSGLVVAISHDGGTAATNRALEASRAAGARTALVTVTRRSPAAAFADVVVETAELDQSWCHTVGYLSPLLVGWCVGRLLAGGRPDPESARRRVAEGIEASVPVAADVAARLARSDRIVVVASGADRPAGRELVLKLEEGAWLPSAYRDLETFLHGHLPATGPRTGFALLLADPRARPERISRAAGALRAVNAVDVTAMAIVAEGVSDELDEELTPAGRIVLPEAPDLEPAAAALFATATALQVLTERIARARGANPDPIRRDDERYRRASAAVEG